MSKQLLCLAALGLLTLNAPAFAQTNRIVTRTTVFAGTSPYHNILVLDQENVRTLFFDDTMESQMLINSPYEGGFEYADYFQMIWLWKPDVKSVLMMGLGGASTQKEYAHYHPTVKMETVEIDPMVSDVAQKYFAYKTGDLQKLDMMDGRQFLVRSKDKYDAILMDAYTQGRYGASIPPHLVTKEFFQIARDHLAPNGVLAYNVITILKDYNTDIVAAMLRTMKEVFPQVYMFQAKTSLNVVIVATMAKDRVELPALKKIAGDLVDSKKMTFPNFLDRLDNLVPITPATYANAPVLTDDFTPVESLTNPAAPAKPKTP